MQKGKSTRNKKVVAKENPTVVHSERVLSGFLPQNMVVVNVLSRIYPRPMHLRMQSSALLGARAASRVQVVLNQWMNCRTTPQQDAVQQLPARSLHHCCHLCGDRFVGNHRYQEPRRRAWRSTQGRARWVSIKTFSIFFFVFCFLFEKTTQKESMRPFKRHNLRSQYSCTIPMYLRNLRIPTLRASHN